MSCDFLSQIIRSYGGGAMQGVIGCYLEQSMKLFATQQREVRERAKSVVGSDPQEIVAAVTQRNYQRWRSVQDEFFRTLIGATARVRSEYEADDEKAAGNSGAT